MKNQITEQFLTIQGEGRSVGRPAYFIRFAGCNLWCEWCDSLHSVDPKLFKGKTFEIDETKIPDSCDLIVLTGGEPTLFDLESIRVKLLKKNPARVFEVESNGTNFPEKIADKFVWNLSPKLRSSRQKDREKDEKRLQKIDLWARYSRRENCTNVSFKFVMSTPEDLIEVDQLVKMYQLPKHLIYLMAEGTSKDSQALEKVEWIVEACKERGFNFTPRLHIMLWGDRRGI